MATLRLPEIVRSAAGGEGLSRFHIGDLRAGQGVAADRGNAVFPTSPYGCAKAFATQLARVYRQSYGMFVCNGILYNHESPRRGRISSHRKLLARLRESPAVSRRSLFLGIWRAGATGAMRASMSVRCG